MPTPRLPHVQAVKRGDSIWLYYRRAGRRWRLPGPEGSALFLDAYNQTHAAWGTLRAETPPGTPGTVDAAIIAYLRSADYQQLAERTRRDYRRTLDGFRTAFGPLHLSDLTLAWWEDLRDKHAAAPIAWNNLRARMRDVIARYRKRHPELAPSNPLLEVARLPVPESDQNKAWPAEVLHAVLAAATPNFRALLIAYLLTAQRGGDVTTWRRDQLVGGIIQMRQRKGGKAHPMPVPQLLAEAIEAQPVRHPERLLCSPRGKPWTLPNAQETLARLLHDLGLPRYTLHGLRATGPTRLKQARHVENRVLRELTGHTSDRNLEVYLRGAGGLDMRRDAVEMLETLFAPAIGAAELAGNQRRFAGVTGRAARVATGLATGNSAGQGRGRKPQSV